MSCITVASSEKGQGQGTSSVLITQLRLRVTSVLCLHLRRAGLLPTRARACTRVQATAAAADAASAFPNNREDIARARKTPRSQSPDRTQPQASTDAAVQQQAAANTRAKRPPGGAARAWFPIVPLHPPEELEATNIDR